MKNENKEEEEEKEVPPRLELGLLDSESNVLTTRPWNHVVSTGLVLIFVLKNFHSNMLILLPLNVQRLKQFYELRKKDHFSSRILLVL
jgi:hypothetical protein